MIDSSERHDPLHGPIISVFARYAIPEIAGMIALSSAGLIDAIFLGNFVGAEALAAVNLSIPVWSLIFGVGLMVAVGGSVECGKQLGEGKVAVASSLFTRTVIVSIALSLLLGLLPGLVFTDTLVAVLGATEERLAEPLQIYLTIMLCFVPVIILETVFYYFVRLDGQPVLAAAAVALGSVVNIFLDWLLIVRFEAGIMGAAAASVVGAGVATLVLFPHFFSQRSRLRFAGPLGNWLGLSRAYLNGASEFANEASLGVTAFIFNWVMVSRMGVEGVAALAIVDYLLMAGLVISYGISDSLQPIISQNFGARNPERIIAFLRTASIAIVVVGIAVSLLTLLMPKLLTGAFLRSDDRETNRIAVEFLLFLWPAFLFNGPNILVSTYLTAMQKPVESAFIAFSRSFALPAALLLLLPIWLGDVGIFLTLPLAEALTFAASLAFYFQNTPSRIIENEITASSQVPMGNP